MDTTAYDKATRITRLQHPGSPIPSSSFLSFINPDLTSLAEYRNEIFWVLSISLVPQDPGREVALDWMCCGWIFGTSLYVDVNIDGPCVEETQVRNTQIDIGSD